MRHRVRAVCKQVWQAGVQAGREVACAARSGLAHCERAWHGGATTPARAQVQAVKGEGILGLPAPLLVCLGVGTSSSG